MRPVQSGNKLLIPIAVVVVGLVVSWMSRRNEDATLAEPPAASAREAPSPARDRASFDFYLMVMTLHAAFCADGNARKSECRAGEPVMLSIHGLWPENLRPGTYPRNCPGPRLDLEAGTEAALRPLMPGMADGLHHHEWRTHGTCAGLDDDDYFRHTLRLARELDAALRGHLTTVAGGRVDAADLRRVADRRQPGLGDTLTFHCRTLREAPPAHRGEPFLVEIRQCVDDDASGAPGPLLRCADVNRRDQGCGRSFRIAAGTRP